MMARLFLYSALFLLLSTSEAYVARNRVTLSTTHGDVIGERKATGSGLPNVEVFYGIPFAKPPVGSFRFRAPSPADPWGSSPRDGTVKPNACWQAIDGMFQDDEKYNMSAGVNMWNPNTERSEDCLYLNVWRPEGTSDSTPGSGDADDSGSSHKTIMVWIFGGGFYSGSATLDVYEASQLAVREDVIVVSIGYRVGVFGFLYLGNEKVPGNAGLMDQNMALKWIKDNAINLGGHPEDITIFGESAGAVSVGLHLLSPLSMNLFQNAIMQSSSPLAEWAVMDNEDAKLRSLNLGVDVSCLNSTEDVNEDTLLDCLQGVDADTLSNKQWNVIENWFDVTMGPVVDGTFLTASPAELMRDGDIKITNVILGVNKDEGIYFDLYGFAELQDLSRKGHLNSSEFDEIMLKVAKNKPDFRTQLVTEYSTQENSYVDIVDASSGDFLFKCSVVDFAREYSKLGGKVYTYSFEQDFSSNPWPNWMGVPHGYEIEAIFGIPLKSSSNNTVDEQNLTSKMMGWWANFAKTGSPSKDKDRETWPLYTTENEEYVIINTSGLHLQQRLRKKQCELWASQRQPSTGANVGVASQEAKQVECDNATAEIFNDVNTTAGEVQSTALNDVNTTAGDVESTRLNDVNTTAGDVESTRLNDVNTTTGAAQSTRVNDGSNISSAVARTETNDVLLSSNNDQSRQVSGMDLGRNVRLTGVGRPAQGPL